MTIYSQEGGGIGTDAEKSGLSKRDIACIAVDEIESDGYDDIDES